MMIQSTREREDPTSNGWENLLPKLDRRVIDAPANLKDWQRLDRGLVFWLVHTVAKYPWLNHLALAGVIYASSGAVYPLNKLSRLHRFLCWAIPDRYPTVAALKPKEALEARFGDPPVARGEQAYKAYTSLQGHMRRYLESLPLAKRVDLEPFLLPTLSDMRRLSKLQAITTEQTKRARKEQSFGIVKTLPTLVALGRQRYQWLTDLEAGVQQVTQLVKTGATTLPTVITLKDLDGQGELTFRLWDWRSWVLAHRTAYTKNTVYRAQRTNGQPLSTGVFLQFVGMLPENGWFLRAVAVGALGAGRALPAEASQYLRQWNLTHFSGFIPGLLRSDETMTGILHTARTTATGTPDDSRILFRVEPFLAAAAVGLFTLVSIVSTGMRIGELQQVTLDRVCMEEGCLPQFDDATGGWVSGSKHLYWKLYPKGRNQRERYFVTPYILEAMFILLDLHQRYYGEGLKPIRARDFDAFSHVRHFAGNHKFVLQWGGVQIPHLTLQGCLAFLLLEHVCRDARGHAIKITPHLLRHGVAGWLHQNGTPLEEIMALLKQVNLAVTDYYSRLSPEDLHQRIGPALTALAELANIDPAAVRTVDEIKQLAQDALKRYGMLRSTPGGACTSFRPCEVEFKCAGCLSYIPDPTRRAEVQAKIESLSRGIELFSELGDHLTAEVERAHLRDWERRLREIDELARVQLVPPPAAALKFIGTDSLGKTMLQNLGEILSLPSGEKG